MQRARHWLVPVLLLMGGVGELPGSAVGAPTPTPQCGTAVACATVNVNLFGAPNATGLAPGSGTVTSSTGGINCSITDGASSGTCSHEFEWPLGQTFNLSLAFAASTGSDYCDADASVCTSAGDFGTQSGGETFPLGANATADVSLTFAKEVVSMTVTRSGVGTGTVTGSPKPFIACGSTCEASYSSGSTITLDAVPDAGAAFQTWTGACSGQGPTCTLTIVTSTSTNAVFELATSTTTTSETTSQTTPTTSTTVSTPTAPTPAPAPTPTSAPLNVQLLGVLSGRSKLGFRVERVELLTNTVVSATLILTRTTRRLSSAVLRGIPAGDRVLTLVVPSAVTSGKARLRLTVTTASGKSRSFTRSVFLARP